MAKRMVEKEATFDLLSIIRKFAGMLSKDPSMAGKNDSEIRAEAMKFCINSTTSRKQ